LEASVREYEIEEVGPRPKWVCPHCGKVAEKTVEVVPRRSLEPIHECPECGKEVGFGEVKRGIFEWLGRIRQTEPETYSKLLSLMLDPDLSDWLTAKCYWWWAE
jgi:predicted RNA-binding Zn-ribbon protein involved in translation (DUF1610 family)